MAAAVSSPPADHAQASPLSSEGTALLPTNSTPFPFSCSCANLTINARVTNDLAKRIDAGDDKAVTVYIAVGAEVSKLSGYATYHHRQDDQRDDDVAVDDSGSSYRKCWLCHVDLYETEAKRPGDKPVEEAWVTVNLESGIIYGDKLEDPSTQKPLPFSGIRLAGTPSTSTFGRPPNHTVLAPYPPVSQNDSEPQPYITPPHDPFFLPPPFIPSNPHLRDMCNSASDYLRGAHARLEDEVKSFIAMKAKEMRDLEDQVRGEVEMLWGRYTEGPGRDEETTRGRSASTSRSRSRSRQRDESKKLLDNTDIAVGKAATSPTTTVAPGASLLGQSLSANTYYGPKPTSSTTPAIRDAVDATIDQVAKTYGKKDDGRAVAMSYVFSSFADRMGGTSEIDQSRRRSSSKSAVPESLREEAHDKDSWIDDEKILATMRREDIIVEEEEAGTLRPKSDRELPEEKRSTRSKGKERSKVTFEEPQDGNAAKDEGSDQEEYVFDFELDDDKDKEDDDDQGFVGSHEPTPSLAHLPISRTRNMVEANLSRTFAADAPSHRAAWRRIEQNGSMYASLRRGSSDDDDEEGAEESAISKLAVSVPVAINLPKRNQSASGKPAFERKTSLSERQGVLVPPLIMAMRERGILSGEGASRGRPRASSSSSANETSRRAASVSREREQVKSFAADPGAMFESLADEDSTPRDSKSKGRQFVPPHILARKEDDEELPDVGWRSRVNN